MQCQIYSLVKDSFSWEQSFIIKEEEEQCLSGLGQHLEVSGQSVINSVKAATCGLGCVGPIPLSQANQEDAGVEPSE